MRLTRNSTQLNLKLGSTGKKIKLVSAYVLKEAEKWLSDRTYLTRKQHNTSEDHFWSS